MNFSKPIIFLLSILFISELGLSQLTPGTVKPELKLNFRLPSPRKNVAFKSILDGVADVDATMSLVVKDKFIPAIGYNFATFKYNEFSLTELLDGSLQFTTIFGQIGYRHHLNEDFYVELSMRAGSTSINSSSQTCQANEGHRKVKQSALSYRPSITLFLKSGETYAFGFTLAQNFTSEVFNSDLLCLPQFGGYNPADSNGDYRYFSVGFSVNIFLHKNPDKQK